MIIIAMAAVTAPTRLLPLWLLGGKTLPKWFVTWLKFVPVAVLAAMVFPELLLRGGEFQIDSTNEYLWVGIPTFALGIATRNLFLPIIAGMAGLALLRYFSIF